LFSGGVFDTKYIATHVTPCNTFGRTALHALRNHLLAIPGLSCCFVVDESRKSSFDFSFKELNVPHKLPEARSHEAGYDALVTAQIFVCLAAAEAKERQTECVLWNSKP
ncbi:CAF1 family ribonuclease domain containing protein, putative, partial [Eimeria tenella]